MILLVQHAHLELKMVVYLACQHLISSMVNVLQYALMDTIPITDNVLLVIQVV